MQENQLFERSPVNLNVMVGLGLLAHRIDVDDILEAYDGLTYEDIQACLVFAGKSVESPSFLPLAIETT